MSEKKTVADYLVAFLAAAGVRQIFGYPGAPLIPLLAALERQSEVQWVLMRHENAAALAASAQGKLTGNLSVCVATSGPGAINFVCGLMEAHLDRVPMLALTGLAATDQQAHLGFQDIDQSRIFATFLSKSTGAQTPGQLTSLLRNYIGHALQQNEAVHIGLPVDVLSAEVDADNPLFVVDPDWMPGRLKLMPPPPAAFDIVAADIDKTEQVAIVVGQRAAGCGPEIEALAETLGAPILTMFDAKGVIDESHPNAMGVVGIWGVPGLESSKAILEEADAVIAFGADTMKPFLTDDRDVQRLKLFECEAEASFLTHEYRRARTLIGPLPEIAKGLRERVKRRQQRVPVETYRAARAAFVQSMHDQKEALGPSKDGNPLTFVLKLNEYLNEQTILVLDAGANSLWSAQFLKLTKRQRVLISSHLGTMGISIPSAIAAKLTYPDRPVVTIVGDGGVQMVIAELATAVQYRLGMVICIFNNGLLQNVATAQVTQFGTELYNPDFVAVARAYGADGAVVDGNTNLDEVFTKAFAPRDTPFVIDLRSDPRMLVPLSKWVRTPAK